MKSQLFACVLTLCFVTSVFGSELNVQGGSSTGGNAHTIVGRTGGLMRFSVTGAFNDVVYLYVGPLGGGGCFASITIRQLATGSVHPLIRYDVVKLPDGQTRVFLGVANAHPIFNGGRICLQRGSTIIDCDPIVVH